MVSSPYSLCAILRGATPSVGAALYNGQQLD